MTLQWKEPVPKGYTKAANVVIGYDGGNHSLYGRLLACNQCGMAVIEMSVFVHDQWHVDLNQQSGNLRTASDLINYDHNPPH